VTSAAERTRCSTTTNRVPGFFPTRADCPPSIEALARMHLAVLTPVNHAACSPQALNAKDRGKPPAEPDASLHSLYAETMAGHVEGDDSTETAVRTLTKKEEVAESSSSPARRSVTPLAPGRHDTCARQRAARADTARRTRCCSCCSCCSTLMTGSPRPRSRDQAPIST